MKPNMRLTIEQKTGGGNFADDPPVNWSTVRVEWFSLEPLSGREYEQAQRMESAVTHKAECEFFVGAKTTMRLKSSDGTRLFHVESVFNQREQNRTLEWRLIEVEVPATVEASE